jgi:acyl carrier protein
MGLEIVDLVFRMEKRFGIRFDRDLDIEHLGDTAGRVHRLVMSKLLGQSLPRVGLAETYATASQVCDAVPGGRWRWRSSNRLERILPRAHRERAWRELGRALNCRLPELECVPGDIATRIPAECATLVDLTWWVIHRREAADESVVAPSELPPGNEYWTPESVWLAVRETIAEVTGIDADEIVPDSRMITDLGMG